MVKSQFSYGFPMVFLWFSYGFPMVSHGIVNGSLVVQLPPKASDLPRLQPGPFGRSAGRQVRQARHQNVTTGAVPSSKKG